MCHDTHGWWWISLEMSQAGEGREVPSFVAQALKQKALVMIPLLLLCPRVLRLSRDLGLLTTVLGIRRLGPRREVLRGHAGLEAVLYDRYLGWLGSSVTGIWELLQGAITVAKGAPLGRPCPPAAAADTIQEAVRGRCAFFWG